MIKSIDDLDLQDKRVFLRVDFNVPLDTDGTITDDTRFALPCPPFENFLSLGLRLFWQVTLGDRREKKFRL
jgi:phosphoglycerate kinase